MECGANLITAETGSVSKEACLVPAGYGVISLEPLAAALCVDNQYGINDTRPAVAGARCTPCGANLLTGENLPSLNTTAPTTGYQNDQACLTQPGWGLPTSGVAEQCPLGTWSAGGSRSPCTPCDGGYTTLQIGSTSDDDCVIIPGWRYNSAVNPAVPEPCDKGTWSAGGTNVTRQPTTCTACGTGFTTQEDEATSAADCNGERRPGLLDGAAISPGTRTASPAVMGGLTTAPLLPASVSQCALLAMVATTACAAPSTRTPAAA